MIRSLLAASVLAGAVLLPAIAQADDFDYRGKLVVTDTVSAGDLDLSTRGGMDRLIRRLRSRIDDMCGGDADCRDEAWLSADWQVARAAERDQWRRRVDYERSYDRRYYRGGGGRAGYGPPPPPPADYDDGPPPPPPVTYDRVVTRPMPAPRLDYAVPPPMGAQVTKTTTVTTQTFTVKTTTVTLTYRLPPAGPWRPRCGCQ